VTEPIFVSCDPELPDDETWPPHFQRWAMERIVSGILRSGHLRCVIEVDPAKFSGRWFDLLAELVERNAAWRDSSCLDEELRKLPEPSRRLWDEIERSLPSPSQEIRNWLRRLKAPEAAPELPVRPLVIRSEDDIPPAQIVQWRADRSLPSEGFAMFLGDPGVGKTMFALDLALRIVCGEKTVDGQPIQSAPVLFVEAEGGESNLHRRLALLGAGRSFRDPLVVLYGNVRLNDGPTMAALKRIIHDYGIKVMFLDPLSVIASVDENKNDAIRGFYDHCILPFVSMGILVIALHHPRKGEVGNGDRESLTLRDIRGGTFWEGALDLALGFTGSVEEACSVEVLKNRNEPVRPFVWRLDDLRANGVEKMVVRSAVTKRVAAIQEAIVDCLSDGAKTRLQIAEATRRSDRQVASALKLILSTAESPIELVQENRVVKYRLRAG